MRLGIYGGSFNPVHIGHLLVAECCREQAALEQVWFVPLSVPAHKQTDAIAPAQHRVEMLRLATGGHEAFHVSTIEIERGGVSYTVDTLDQLRREDPTRELYLILGADALADLPAWRDPARICELAKLLVVRRGGLPMPNFEVLAPFASSTRIEQASADQIEMPAIELSSRELRQRVNEGHSIRFRVPRAVEKYIETQGLYRG